MRIPPRHWLDYDSVALAVLMIAISVLELLVLGFGKQPVAASHWLPSATTVRRVNLTGDTFRSTYKPVMEDRFVVWLGFERPNYFEMTAFTLR